MGTLCVSQRPCLSPFSFASLCQTPCWIVSLCRCFVRKLKPTNTHELKYFAFTSPSPIQAVWWDACFSWLPLSGFWSLNKNFSGYSQPLRYTELTFLSFACEAKFCLDSRFFIVKRRDGWAHNSPRVSCSWYQSVEAARNWLLSLCDKVCMFLTYHLKDCAQFRHRLRFVFEILCSISVSAACALILKSV